jgi:hypothetical protein
MSAVKKLLRRQTFGTNLSAHHRHPTTSRKHKLRVERLRAFIQDITTQKHYNTDYHKQKELLDALRDIGNDMFDNTSSKKKKTIGNFITLDGPFVLMDLIAALVPHKKSGRVGCGGQSGPKYGVGVTHLLNELCSILRELLYDFPGLAHVSTVGSIDFVNLIVDHLLGINNADTAMVLLEEIVAYRTETFRLANIPNFQQIVMTLSSRQLALFMRLFAILIFEPESKHEDHEESAGGGGGGGGGGAAGGGGGAPLGTLVCFNDVAIFVAGFPPVP